MTKQTCDIILACKGSIYPEIDDRIERIKTYMSERCKCDKEYYDDRVMENIMTNAFYDYIDSCDRPSSIIRIMNEGISKDVSITNRIAIAFTLVKVRDGTDIYVNGFKKEFFK